MRRITPALLLAVAAGGGLTPERVSAQATAAGWDPVADRGLLIAKATPIPRGRGHVTAFLPGIVVFGYGASDRVTLVGGTLPWVALNGTGVFFGSARTTIVSSRHSGVAIGASGLFVFEEGATSAGGWPFVSGTLGFPNGSLTALVGVGTGATVLGDRLAGSVLFQGMGELAIERGIKLIVETLYLGDGAEPLGAVGLRCWSGRAAFEIGLTMSLESVDAFYYPWLAISYGF